MNKKATVRKYGDIIRITMYSCFDNHEKFFEMEAPMNNKEKVKTLFEIARLKGLKIPKDEKNSEKAWW